MIKFRKFVSLIIVFFLYLESAIGYIDYIYLESFERDKINKRNISYQYFT